MSAVILPPTDAPPTDMPPADTPLPRLRDDLELFPGPAAPDGGATWSIFDPFRNAYFQIDWRGAALLTRWRLGRAAAVAAAARADTTLQVDATDVMDFARFLQMNELTAADSASVVAWLGERAAARKKSLFSQALHGYLFFRIPLLRPDRFLAATLRWVEPLYSPAWRWCVAALGLIGLLLVSRQWDAFVGGLADMASWEGAAGLAATIALIKILHEFGHAYTARRHRCPVPAMGVAFLVLWPVLFTDTTHVYRLTDRRRRLEVAGAGVMVELFIAALATFAWSLLPPGALRDAAQTAAVASWVGTLAINLNPLMRFDGYYLLADALGLPNLQDRAFAVAKWRLREALFGLGEPPPEDLPDGLRRGITAYALATWLYRFILFLGVALLVYHLAFKALGIFLMAVELYYFIALPIWRELAAWRRLGQDKGFALNRHLAVTLLGAAGAAVLAAWPLPWPAKAPAILHPQASVALHPPAPAQIKAVLVSEGSVAAAGTPLFELHAPDLSFEAERAQRRIAALEALVERESAVADAADRVGVLQEELGTARALAAGVAALQAQLIVKAPIPGRLTDLADPLQPGQWVRPETTLGRVISPDRRRVVAFIAAEDLARAKPGAAARMIFDDPAAPALALRLESVDPTNTEVLDAPYLSARMGGPILTEPIRGQTGRSAAEEDGRAGARERPIAAVYRAILQPIDAEAAANLPPQTLAGRVFIDAAPLSLAQRAWRTAAAALIRESGF